MANRDILYIAEILSWADAHHERTGKWPSKDSGRIQDAPRKETWLAVQMALGKGHRGLRPGKTLAGLLEKHRGHRNKKHLPKLTNAQILRWAKQHRARTGRWPDEDSGMIVGTNGETWSGIKSAFSMGNRGLAKGGGLRKLLETTLGVRNQRHLPRLSRAKILAWADLHYQKTGDWPTNKSGLIYGSRGESWSSIESALVQGLRGIAGGSSISKLLAHHRGVKRHHHRGRQLTGATVLDWAKTHYRRTGEFPRAKSGAIHGHPGETWGALHVALVYGYRGLPKGTTLAKLLAPLKEKLARSGRR